MGDVLDIKDRVPNERDLPQGSDAFLSAHKASHEAAFELHAPFLNKHPGIHSNYLEIVKLLKVIGFYMNDSISMIMNPDLYPAPEQQEEKDAPQAE